MPTHQPDDASIVVDNNDDQVFLPKKKRLNPQIVLSGLLMVIFLGGSGLALMEQNVSTDNRSSASEGEFLEEASAPCTETPGNLIMNPSFEQNLNKWTKNGSGSNIQVITSQPHHCYKSLLFTGVQKTRKNFVNITQPISLLQNTIYRFSLSFKSEQLYPWKELELVILTKANSQSTYQSVYSQVLPVTTSNWGRPEFLISTLQSLSQEELNTARIMIRTKLIKGERIGIDNLSLIPHYSLSPTPAIPTATPAITNYYTPTPTHTVTYYPTQAPTTWPSNYPTPHPQ